MTVIFPTPSSTQGAVTVQTDNVGLAKAWGRLVSPAWTSEAEQTAPVAATALATHTVGAGKSGYVYGFRITAQEANDFKVNWTSATVAKSFRISFNVAGTIEVVFGGQGLAFNEGLPADAASDITITNVNAGGVGKVYQANLLWAEA